MFTKTLSHNAQNALALLGSGRVLPKGTYLAGGSALALHLGHRISIDFDFFTPESFDQESLAVALGKIGEFKTETIVKNTLLGTFNKVRFSLFRYEYPLLFPTIEYQRIGLADARDIGAMKIAAVMDRGTKKDFIDLYFLSRKKVSLDQCLNYYDEKYGALTNNVYSIITSLSYFDETEETEMPTILIPTSWENVKNFFQREAVRLAKIHLAS